MTSISHQSQLQYWYDSATIWDEELQTCSYGIIDRHQACQTYGERRTREFQVISKQVEDQMYLILCSRPDLAYSTSQISQFNATSTSSTMQQ